jgi:adenosine deaminase
MIDHTTARALPKVLLHDHLDGGLRPQTVVELAVETGYTGLPTSDVDDLAAWFHAGAARRSLPLYLETFVHTVGVMQTPSALERVAYECAEDLADDGVVHAEVRFAPELHQQRGMSLADVVGAVSAGFTQARSRIDVRILLTAMRTGDRAAHIARAALDLLDLGVVGFDLAGAELGYPPTAHRAAFDLLRDAGLPCTVHAGESAGGDSIAAALDCGARRLGHGVRVADEVGADGALGPVARRVHEQGIPLELCPTSNVHTGAATDLAAHPVERLRRAGFVVTVNTDNRLMSDVSLSGELGALSQTFELGLDDLEAVTLAAADAAFLDAGERAPLQRRVRDGFHALRRTR